MRHLRKVNVKVDVRRFPVAHLELGRHEGFHEFAGRRDRGGNNHFETTLCSAQVAAVM